MHQLLDVHLEKDQCRVGNKDDRQCLNMFRKAAINLIKNFKLHNNSKPLSPILCLSALWIHSKFGGLLLKIDFRGLLLLIA